MSTNFHWLAPRIAPLVLAGKFPTPITRVANFALLELQNYHLVVPAFLAQDSINMLELDHLSVKHVPLDISLLQTIPAALLALQGKQSC